MHATISDEIKRFNPSNPLSEATTPPSSWYARNDFLELEKKTVFLRNWLCVARSESVAQPGTFSTGVVLKRPFVITRSEDHQLHAFYNVCSHHGTCVAKGQGKTETLVCPYHGWTYSLEGDLKKAPKAGAIQSLGDRNLDLKPIEVMERGPFVWLRFDPEGLSFEDQWHGFDRVFAPHRLEGLEFIKQVRYEIDCNWKVFVDNYLDGGYHVAHMHPALADGLDLKTYRSEIGNYWSVQGCVSGDGPVKRLGRNALYAWVYPNFMINRYGPWMDTNLVLPLSPDRCAVLFDYYYEGTPGEEELAIALAGSDRVQQEDMEICDMVQAGLDSGAYEHGVYAPRFEAPMYHFHQLLFSDFSDNP